MYNIYSKKYLSFHSKFYDFILSLIQEQIIFEFLNKKEKKKNDGFDAIKLSLLSNSFKNMYL